MSQQNKAPSFGTDFLPHMLKQVYSDGKWQEAEIVPFGKIPLSPATAVLHYGQEIFEGFKAYRQPDRSVCLFRADRNLLRMNDSAERLCMPALDTVATLKNIERLLQIDVTKIPASPQTVYIRPFMFATDEIIKVRPSHSYLFCVVSCVVGDYFGGGDPRGVRLRTETSYVRAAPGGTGMAKCGGNYAASLAAQGQAEREGFDQVVWLDAREHRYIEEMGGMNIMFMIDNKLVTPSLECGSILNGVTRDSLIQMCKKAGVPVEERPVTVDELAQAHREGRFQEAFACGTAAAISPIREILHRGEVLFRNETDGPGQFTMALRTQLLDLQFGRAKDPFGWRINLSLA